MTYILNGMTPARRCEYRLGQVTFKIWTACPPTNCLTSCIDRILFKGRDLDLRVYSRAELIGSDHRPGACHSISEALAAFITVTDMSKSVFAIFRAEVRIIDSAKRNALHRILIESVLATAPGERLDEKLATVSLMEESVDCTY